jgi:hypothetical protein
VGVIIGMDPHKSSATIEVIDERGKMLAARRFATDKAGYHDMLIEAQRFPQRVWAIEGCNGIGKHIAHRLVHDGENVLDVPPKLSAQVRVFATGNGRKTDLVDAHSVAIAALHTPNLVRVEVDDDLVVMGKVPRLCNLNQRPLFRHVLHVGGWAAAPPARITTTAGVINNEPRDARNRSGRDLTARFEANGTTPKSSEPMAKSATPPTPRPCGTANAVVADVRGRAGPRS